eukprot:6438068-Pyramimonas_sp.AAC.1
MRSSPCGAKFCGAHEAPTTGPNHRGTPPARSAPEAPTGSHDPAPAGNEPKHAVTPPFQARGAYEAPTKRPRLGTNRAAAETLQDCEVRAPTCKHWLGKKRERERETPHTTRETERERERV